MMKSLLEVINKALIQQSFSKNILTLTTKSRQVAEIKVDSTKCWMNILHPLHQTIRRQTLIINKKIRIFKMKDLSKAAQAIQLIMKMNNSQARATTKSRLNGWVEIIINQMILTIPRSMTSRRTNLNRSKKEKLKTRKI